MKQVSQPLLNKLSQPEHCVIEFSILCNATLILAGMRIVARVDFVMQDLFSVLNIVVTSIAPSPNVALEWGDK